MTKFEAISFLCVCMQTNFQVALVTNENITFAMFLYDENDLESFMTESMRIGFTAADNRRSLSLRDFGAQERIFRTDGEIYYKVL